MDKKEKEEKEEEKKKSKLKNKFNMMPYIPIILLIILLFVLIFFPSREPEIFSKHNYSKIEEICDLALLDVYYHEVATREVDATKLGKYFGNIGYKKYWIEYDAVVQFGIDAKKVKIHKKLFSNVIKVKIPDASIVKEPKVIRKSVSDPITDKGFLTSIDASEKTAAIAEAQKDLKESAENDKEILDSVKERAKTFFEEYIQEIGKENGKNYKVVFVN